MTMSWFMFISCLSLCFLPMSSSFVFLAIPHYCILFFVYCLALQTGASSFICFFMDTVRNNKVLVWNIRGLNSQEKWDALRSKISESACQIICLQETKREHFDLFYLRTFCPRNFDSFFFSPSISASGGLITIWNSRLFSTSLVQSNSYVVTAKFTSVTDNNSFHLTNVCGPSNSNEKFAFITWLLNLDTNAFDD